MPPLILVMPTISWEEPFGICIRAALAGLGPRDEALVVFDGVPPPAPDWLLSSRARLMSTGHRSGPAAARNRAAQQARGDILLFVDADVELHADAMERIRARFANDPELAAVFGSYDDRPAAPGVVSRFRNLLHHHTHSSHPGPATTFWAGCGAVRRQAFLDLGGFDADAYGRPCIEDIEFGLRLSDAGGRILLDPAIQGTHHKRWTLRSMVVTDIGQRAIPWSRLLLKRRELPASLNLNPEARLSAAASLLLPVALFGALLPALRPAALALGVGALALLLMLNRPFHSLLLQRCGWLEAAIGVALHALYLAYSSLTLVLVALADGARRPLLLPSGLRSRPRLQRSLVATGLALLALLALAATLKGLLLGWHLNDTDLYERLDEWRLFQQGIYPSGRLASAAERALPHFRTSVYLPWALPLFAGLFAWGGAMQGTLVIQALSLLSLALIAALGWRALRPWGTAAGWLGALAPLAIAANSNTLAQGQFSIVCMGLLSLQWLLLLRDRPLPAGLCWAMAMVKPQIAACFALPFLGRGRRRGLAVGLALLAGLTALALLHTNTDPLAYLASWLAVLPGFIGDGNVNAAASLLTGWRGSGSHHLLAAALLAGLAVIIGAWLGSKLLSSLADASRRGFGKAWRHQPLTLAGLCGVVGAVAVYHRNVDNIMLFPALLAALRLGLGRHRLVDGGLAVLMAASVWTPQRLLDLWPGSALAQSLIWGVLAIRLLAEMVSHGDEPVRPDSSSGMPRPADQRLAGAA